MKKYIIFVITFSMLAAIHYLDGFELAILAGLSGIFAQLEERESNHQ